MKIVKIPNKILNKKIEKIEKITPEIEGLISDMKETMKTAQGIGLAANQVGQDMAFFIIDEEIAKEHNAPTVYINPELTLYPKEEVILEEGCLSIPEKWLEIKRSKKVKIKAMNEQGKKFKLIAKDLLARVLQHEYDHINGILITGRIHIIDLI